LLVAFGLDKVLEEKVKTALGNIIYGCGTFVIYLHFARNI